MTKEQLRGGKGAEGEAGRSSSLSRVFIRFVRTYCSVIDMIPLSGP